MRIDLTLWQWRICMLLLYQFQMCDGYYLWMRRLVQRTSNAQYA